VLSHAQGQLYLYLYQIYAKSNYCMYRAGVAQSV